MHVQKLHLQICAAAARKAAVALFLTLPMALQAQMLSVLPVNIFLQPGERTAAMTVTNPGSKPTSIQIRCYEWTQDGSEDQTTATDAVLASPPLVTIPPSSSQVVRIFLRRPAQGKEATYRILLDQIPGAGEPGMVQMVLRLSIPIFVQPAPKLAPKVAYRVVRDGDTWYLEGQNTGNAHESLREIELTTAAGTKIVPDGRVSPYILAGATHRWPLHAAPDGLKPGERLKLKARGVSGAVEMETGAVATP